MIVRISGADRDALFHAAVEDFRVLPALAEAVETGQWNVVRMLGLRYMAEFRLLDDLGWQPIDAASHYELTMSETQLARVLLRLRTSTLVEGMGLEKRDPDWMDRASRVATVCASLLRDMAPAIVQDADEPPLEEW